MKSGIYKIKNNINGLVYIGSTINLNKRWYTHKYGLNNNIHDNSYLQKAWNKYGEQNFSFEIIEYVEPTLLINREQHYIDKHMSFNRKCGYNLSPTAGNTLGFKFSPQSKEKMSKMKKGKPSNRKNYVLSEETKKKISESNKLSQKGRKHNNETKKKMSDNRKGHIMSDDTKQKLSEWRKGLRPSSKTGEYINDDLKNIFNTTENKEKIKKSKLKNKINRKHTLESKKKISNSNKKNNRGEHNGMSTTSTTEVINIRKDYECGSSIKDLQIKYNKKYHFIYKIVKRLRWEWLDDCSFRN